jgi:DedD protein
MARSMARQRVQEPGAARWLIVAAGLIAVLVLTFALGLMVGRKWSPSRGGEQMAAEPTRKPPAPVSRRSGLTEPEFERAPHEKLTFYQTLTAPMSTAPAPIKVSALAKLEPAKPRPATERVTADRAVPQPVSAPKPEKLAERPPTPRAAEARTGDWAVQVGVFKDRGLAEGVRRPLAASGFDTYLTAVPTTDGQTHYKVRMGSFKTREEAARMAERVRQERSLTAFVTPK